MSEVPVPPLNNNEPNSAYWKEREAREYEEIEDLARELCDTYYLTVDPTRPMSNAYEKVTEVTRAHWRAQASLMRSRGWTR